MAFAQLTYCESLRDSVACLRSADRRLYHLGIRGHVSRSTLADANETRDWRIYADFAQVLIAEARRLYVGEDLGIDLANTVYALDSTVIDLCMTLFPWARYSRTQHAVKLHTLLDLRGSIPTFIRITPAQVRDINVLDLLTPEPGAFYVMDRGYLDFERLYRWTLAGTFFVTRACNQSGPTLSERRGNIGVNEGRPTSAWSRRANCLVRSCHRGTRFKPHVGLTRTTCGFSSTQGGVSGARAPRRRSRSAGGDRRPGKETEPRESAGSSGLQTLDCHSREPPRAGRWPW
jgi:hypothetical protein